MTHHGARSSRRRIALLVLGLAAAICLVAFGAIHYYLADTVTLQGQALSWFEWTELVGVVLGIAGLLVAIVEAARARSAAESAREAVDETLGALGRTELLVDLQALRQLEFDLDSAVKQKDADTVERLLRDWREIGARVVVTLKQRDATDELIDGIESARMAANQVKVVLIGGRKNMNLGSATQKFREEISPVCDIVSTRMNELRLDLGRKDEDG